MYIHIWNRLPINIPSIYKVQTITVLLTLKNNYHLRIRTRIVWSMMTVRLINYNAARMQKEVVVYSLAINLMQLRNIWGSVSILILHLFHVYCMYFFSSFRSLSFARPCRYRFKAFVHGLYVNYRFYLEDKWLHTEPWLLSIKLINNLCIIIYSESCRALICNDAASIYT